MDPTARDARSLSQKEREVLRPLLTGHDAKSIARLLGLSVHTVNERLRDARRKLGVSSSREAARILARQEGGPDRIGPKKIGYEQFGVEAAPAGIEAGGLPGRRAAAFRPPFLGHWTGPAMIATSIVVAAALIARTNAGAASPRPPAAPHVVATSPANGAVVPAGPLTLTVTFDRPMHAGSYSFVQKDPATYPECGDNRPNQSRDGRTFTLHCMVQPGRRYEIWFNAEPYMNFKSVDGIAATPFQLRFQSRAR